MSLEHHSLATALKADKIEYPETCAHAGLRHFEACEECSIMQIALRRGEDDKLNCWFHLKEHVARRYRGITAYGTAQGICRLRGRA